MNSPAYPMLSDRRNIVVIADEAHRSQYGFRARIEQKTGEIAYGFAKYLRRHERTFTGGIKSGLHATHRVPSMEMPPPGTIMWTCG